MTDDSYRVLIVDDDFAQAEMMQEFLHLSGSFRATIVGDLQSLWTCLAGELYDIVLLDYMLPDGNGLEALEQFKARGFKVPVVMVTGQGDERTAATSIQRGAVDYVIKSDDFLVGMPAMIRKAVRAFELEQSVQRSLEQIRYQATLLDNVRDAIVVWDLQGRITYWNPAAVALFGWQAEERLNWPVEEAYFPIFTPPVSVPEPGGPPGQHVERRCRNRAGDSVWVSSRTTALYDDGGQCIGFMDVSYDITRRKEIEQALRTERNFVSAVLDTVGALVVVLDDRGRIVRFNRACEQVTGYSFTEVRGKNFWDLISEPEKAEATRRVFERLDSGAFPRQDESTWRNRRGEDRLITWSNTAITSDSGAISYIIATGIDITERRQAEQALRESEARYRAIVEDYQTELICRFRPDGRLTFVNEAFCRYFEKDRADFLGQDMLSILPEIEHVNALNHLSRFSPEQPVGVREHQVILRDGERRWQRWADRAIFDQNGQIFEIQSIGHDITDRKRAEEALKASEQHIRTIYEAVASGVIVLDHKGRINHANGIACQFLGVPLEQLLGEPSSAVFENAVREDGSPIPADSTPAAITRENAQPVENQVLGLNPPGSRELRWALVNSVPAMDESGALVEVVITLVDITERKQMEAQIRAAQTQLTQAARLATIGEMASGVAHQINNPLTTIIADSQILLREVPPEHPARESAEAIEQAGWRLQEAVQRLLEFSRPGSGSQENVSINHTIRQALSLVGAHIEANGVAIQVDLAEEAGSVRGNARQLEDLWLNLLLLARDATQDGESHTISIRSRLGAEMVTVAVRDDGIPVPSDQLEAIFEPNFVGPTSGRGTGMELSICREIVRQHGGEISAELTAEHDTIFHVTLPVIKPSLPP